jgi:hypothetical protein
MGEEPKEPTRAALWEGLAVVVTGFALGLGGIVYTHFSRQAGAELDTGPGEAFAALAGAVVGLGGAEIGQATGTFRAAQEQLHGHHRRFDVALTLVAVVAALGRRDSSGSTVTGPRRR